MDAIIEISIHWPEPSLGIKIGFHVARLLLCLFGIASNVIIIIALQMVKESHLRAFYFICTTVALCDLVKLIIRVIRFPFEVVEYKGISQDFLQIFNAVLYMLFYTATIFWFIVVFLAATNRFLAYIWSSANKLIFGNHLRLQVLVLLIFLLILACNILAFLPNKVYYVPKLFFLYHVGIMKPIPFYIDVAQFINDISNYPLMFSPVLYCIHFFHLHRKLKFFRETLDRDSRSNQARIGKEILLIVQGFTFWVLVVLVWIFYYYLLNVELIPKLGYYWLFILAHFVDILQNVVHPFIYILCDSLLRRKVMKIVHMRSTSATVGTTFIVNSSSNTNAQF